MAGSEFVTENARKRRRRKKGSSIWLDSFTILFLMILAFCSTLILGSMEESVQYSKSCNNTIQGRHLLADDRGYVCGVWSINQFSGCCPESSDQFSCQGCKLSSQCCDSYEYCVSCCLNPARTVKELAIKMKVAKQATAGTHGSVFKYCTGRCRHNSASVVHENAYASEIHHCFSLQLNSSGLIMPHAEVELSDISIIIGRQGQSCNLVCKSRGQSCILRRLLELNNCVVLQKYMSCKGACIASRGSEQPAEVTDDAPRHLHPGACLFSRKQTDLSCDGSHPHTRRLCPCA